MKTHRTLAVATIAMIMLVGSAIRGGANPAGVVKESGRTAGHAVRDSAQTVGRTVRDFFTHGPHTAKRTWLRNAARTRAEAHADAHRVTAQAHDER